MPVNVPPVPMFVPMFMATIFDANEAHPARRFSGLLTLLMGIALSTWYVRDIGKTVRGDLQTFPLSFRVLPILTIVFAVFKLVAYIAFGALFAIMIYVPLCNLWLTKSLTGRIESIEQGDQSNHQSYILVRLDGRVCRFRDSNGLKSALEENTSRGNSVRFVIGAFGRVERVEKLD
jgi:hypothetical protein